MHTVFYQKLFRSQRFNSNSFNLKYIDQLIETSSGFKESSSFLSYVRHIGNRIKQQGCFGVKIKILFENCS